jgi:hypothetical protein
MKIIAMFAWVAAGTAALPSGKVCDIVDENSQDFV